MSVTALNLRTGSASIVLIALIVLTAIYTLALTILWAHGLGATETIQSLWTLGFQLILALWIRANRYDRGFSSPYDFDASVLFAWVIVIPYCFYRTRRLRGLFAAAAIFALWFAPSVVATVLRPALARQV